MDALPAQPSSRTDVLLSIRGRITARTGLVAAGLILPFSAFHLSQGRYALALLDLLAALIFGGNAWALIVRDRPLMPYPALVAALALAVLGSVHFVGGVALHWAFPATMFFTWCCRAARRMWPVRCCCSAAVACPTITWAWPTACALW
ncbi:hypothetical protein [Ideonella paludis]|uniref:hypothetical protein n=1 Tax=Ideonella paludis TaxID=1233411 RepID=UPI003638E5E8